MRRKRLAGGAAGIALCAGLAFALYAWHPTIDPIAPPAPDGFDPALARRGAQLAAIGNCNVCHTAPGGEAYAGGLPIETPFGTIHATNITPDPDTGIGRWSEAAFARSMRSGVDRGGRHLYPAFPYDHFTRVSDEDNRAIYAFLMTRPPVRAEVPPNDLPFPLNVRMALAGWKLLFFREGPRPADPARGEEWNRGAYLAEGLGHCGSCHTPRNALGAERGGAQYAGAAVEGWYAYAINADAPAPVPWTADSLADYLSRGWHAEHGIARGPMAPVTSNLSAVPAADVRAIAAYVASVMGEPSAPRRERGEAVLAEVRGALPGRPGARTAAADSQAPPGTAATEGAAIYAAACASCHEAGRPPPFGGIHLALSTAPRGPDPRNLANVVLHGLPAAEGERAPIMPGFRAVLDDRQVAVLLSYLRERYADGPAWSGVEELSREARRRGPGSSARPMDAVQAGPAEASQRGTSW